MKKILNNLAIIQIVICALCFFSIYFPVVKVKAGTVNKNYNAFSTIIGIKADSIVINEFSFWNLLPYLIIIVIIILNIFLDNKKRLVLHIVKASLFLASALLLFFFVRLMNPGDFFVSVNDMLRFVSPLYGHIITGSLCVLGFLITILEILKDVKVIKA